MNNTFYIVNSASTIGQINAALGAGDNLLFTPGVYSYASAINVTKADTKVIGLGFATIIPTNGNDTITVADVPDVNISGLILDAGPVNSPALPASRDTAWAATPTSARASRSRTPRPSRSRTRPASTSTTC